MKKSRPALTVAALAPADRRDAVVAGDPARVDQRSACASGHDAHGVAAPIVDGRHAVGAIAGQGAAAKATTANVAPEYEDCRRAARSRRRPGQARLPWPRLPLSSVKLRMARRYVICCSAVPSRDRIRLVGGDEAARAGYLAELRGGRLHRRGCAAAHRGRRGRRSGARGRRRRGSRRDGSGALVDAVTAARKAAAPPPSSPACRATSTPRSARSRRSASLASGADDVVVAPPDAGALLARVGAGLKMSTARIALERFERYGEALVAHRAAPSESRSMAPEALPDILGPHLRRRRLDARARSCSPGDDRATCPGRGVGRRAAMKVPLKLERYPEVRACMESREPVLVEDARASALLGPWAELAAEKGGRALLAVPLMVERAVVGAILLRSATSRGRARAARDRFPALAASMWGWCCSRAASSRACASRRAALAGALRDRAPHARARAVQATSSRPRPTAWSSLDADGAILYVNRAAEQMTGYAREGLGRPRLHRAASPPGSARACGTSSSRVRRAAPTSKSFDLAALDDVGRDA